ncbi:MAG: sigma-70 family RNA polymerase sigma factor [Clostridia bacterium]|nr:sigma-70 family RNA polymerase sigma factor [Clostridia bacterium]
MYDSEKNIALLEEAKSGDAEVVRVLCENNMGLVRTVAGAFRERGVELEDLMQIGTIGLIKAIRGYDASYGTVFSTYAVPLIMGEIKKYLRDDGIVKVSRTIKRNAQLVSKKRDQLSTELGREPTLSELSAAAGLTDEETLSALEASSPILSFDAQYGDITLENLIGTDNIGEAVERIALHQAIKKLEREEQTIVRLRFFKNMTQSQVASALGSTQVKISRQEKKIVAKLREILG